MQRASEREPWGPGRYILQYRAVIGIVLIVITAYMGYWATRVQIATKFENFFPANHEDTLLYRKYQYRYGGAQTLMLMLRVRRGDIFTVPTLTKVQDLTREVNILPGVDHNEIFSLASYRVAFPRVIPGAIITTNFMYPRVPQTAQGLEQLRANVGAHFEQVAGLITRDNKGALITASFNEDGLDYKLLFDDLQQLVHKYTDSNTD